MRFDMRRGSAGLGTPRDAHREDEKHDANGFSAASIAL
jgi:hypothetical protein